MEGLWYLLAFDVHRQDWRIFRADRINRLESTLHRFEPRALPDERPEASPPAPVPPGERLLTHPPRSTAELREVVAPSAPTVR